MQFIPLWKANRSFGQNIPRFMEHEGLLPLLQEHLARPCAEPLEFSPYLHALSFKYMHCNIIISSTSTFSNKA
jgi:hypothetical protein